MEGEGEKAVMSMGDTSTVLLLISSLILPWHHADSRATHVYSLQVVVLICIMMNRGRDGGGKNKKGGN